MKLTSTKTNLKYINCLIYGRYGIGKTPLAATAPKPIIIDTEGGTLSISDLDLPMLEVRSIEELDEAYDFIKGKKGNDFESVVIDSGSELAEIILSDFKKEHRDPRKAYGEMGEELVKVLRKFKDLKKNLIVTAKAKIITLNGYERYRASFPGPALTEAVPYLFDEVFCLRFSNDDDNEGKDEDNFKILQAKPDEDYDAKDRSRKLKFAEKPDLAYIFEKILSGQPQEEKKKKKKKKKKSTEE